MLHPIVVKADGYEAWTDGLALEVRRKNGVVIGEGRIQVVEGALRVGDYTGEVDEHVHRAVRELLEEYQTDLVVHWFASERRGEPS